MLKIKKLCAIAALIAAPLAAADELSSTGELLDAVVAIVNEGVVLRSEFDKELAGIKKRAADQDIPLPPEDVLNEQVLERLIVNEIQMQRANNIGLTDYISDQFVNSQIQEIAERSGANFEDMPRLLAADGIDYASFREEVRKELILNELRSNEVTRSINVSEREIEQCIIDLETNVVVNSDWNLSHILLTIKEGANADEVAAVETQADEIYARLQDGADFRQLAVRFSGGPTALEGGALGWLNGQQVPSIFTEVLQDMKAGDVSEPFRTANSIHIVKVDDLRLAVERSEINQAKVRHILISPNAIIDDATAKQRLEDVLEKLRAGDEEFSEQAKLISDDPGSANLGGDLGWAVTTDYAPEFREVADTAEVGVISEPFRTQFGWHILEVVERRVYDNTEELKERNCIVRIRASKLEEETLLWLQRMRDEAFVESRI